MDRASIDFRYSAAPLKVFSSLRVAPYDQAILKLHHLSILVYRAPSQTPGKIEPNIYALTLSIERPYYVQKSSPYHTVYSRWNAQCVYRQSHGYMMKIPIANLKAPSSHYKI